MLSSVRVKSSWMMAMVASLALLVIVLLVASVPAWARESPRQSAAQVCRIAMVPSALDASVVDHLYLAKEQEADKDLDDVTGAQHITLKEPQASLNVQLDAWGENSVRIRISPDTIIQTPDVQALLAFAPDTRTTCTRSWSSAANPQIYLENGNIAASLSGDGTFQITRISDGVALVDAAVPPQFTVYNDPSTVYKMPHSLYATQIAYQHKTGDLYGLGEHKTGVVRYPFPFTHLFEDSQIYADSRGGDLMIPWYLSSSGFGVLFNHPGYGFVNMSDVSNAAWSFNATHQLDIWITTIASTSSATATPFAELMTRYAEATSFPEPLPHFASGFWQSKDRYRNQTEVLDIASGFATRQVPVEVFVIDWQHWQYLGDWTFRPLCWADPKAMISQVQSYGFHVMISAWPRVDPHSLHYESMLNASYLTTDKDGKALITADGSTYLYDPFQANARQYVWQALVDGYVQNGIRLFWLDASEPEQSLPGQQYWNGRSDREVGMAWPRYHQQTIFDGSLSAGMPLDEVIILSRSTWVGSSAQNVLVWSGDVFSTWSDFNVQVRIAQNVALSGIWWWTTDIGGYWGGDVTTDNFQELLVRWFQFGAFCPIFRVHGHRFPEETSTECGGSGGPNELWTYKYEQQIASVIDLRQTIRPYVESQLSLASTTGTPVLRPMVFDCADAPCATAEDQFMFGPDWLVAPVLVYQATNRTVYLPSGQQWTHVYTNQTYQGGQTVTIATTLNDFPLFQRVGAAMPVQFVEGSKPVMMMKSSVV